MTASATAAASEGAKSSSKSTPATTKGKVFLVMPAYNEEAGLPPLLDALKELFGGAGRDYLGVVVNDGSRDKTREVAEEKAKGMPLHIINHPTNLNVGAVFRDGISYAVSQAKDGDVIVTLEGDNTNDPSIALALVEKLEDEGLDIVVASRYRKGGKFIGFPLKRRILSDCANTLMRVLYPVKDVSDYSIFYRAYNANTLKRAMAHYGDKFIECPGFVSNAEMLIKCRTLGVKGGELPLLYKYDQKKGGSKMKIKKTIMEYFHFFKRMPRKAR
jgi:dolichol-phosphate mannosyltransferase